MSTIDVTEKITKKVLSLQPTKKIELSIIDIQVIDLALIALEKHNEYEVRLEETKNKIEEAFQNFYEG